jgi:hypothetical protein
MLQGGLYGLYGKLVPTVAGYEMDHLNQALLQAKSLFFQDSEWFDKGLREARSRPLDRRWPGPIGGGAKALGYPMAVVSPTKIRLSRSKR